MERIRVLIVDDEQQSRSLIRKLLSDHFPGFITEEAGDVTDALKKIRDFAPGLVFLDVQMRGETGFDLLDRTGDIHFGIIFTTAHSEFALKAFRYSALDYLIKPISEEEFVNSVEKVLPGIMNKQPASEQIAFLKEIRSGHQLPSRITIPTTQGYLFVTISEIIYCHAAGNYTEFQLPGNKKILSSYTLGYYNDVLASHHFFRVHRSYLVNLDHIRMYKKGDGGSVVMSNGEEIEVSRGNKEAFLKILNL